MVRLWNCFFVDPLIPVKLTFFHHEDTGFHNSRTQQVSELQCH